MISLCSQPFEHDPSGSIDLSICRETYLKFTTPHIETPYPVDIIVSARAINFIITGGESGGVSLKYMS